MADAAPDRPADRPGWGALAVELNVARPAEELAILLGICSLLLLHAGRHGGADREVRLQADPDRQQGEEVPQGRGAAALGAAAGALLLRARLRQPAGRG